MSLELLFKGDVPRGYLEPLFELNAVSAEISTFSQTTPKLEIAQKLRTAAQLVLEMHLIASKTVSLDDDADAEVQEADLITKVSALDSQFGYSADTGLARVLQIIISVSRAVAQLDARSQIQTEVIGSLLLELGTIINGLIVADPDWNVLGTELVDQVSTAMGSLKSNPLRSDTDAQKTDVIPAGNDFNDIYDKVVDWDVNFDTHFKYVPSGSTKQVSILEAGQIQTLRDLAKKAFPLDGLPQQALTEPEVAQLKALIARIYTQLFDLKRAGVWDKVYLLENVRAFIRKVLHQDTIVKIGDPLLRRPDSSDIDELAWGEWQMWEGAYDSDFDYIEAVVVQLVTGSVDASDIGMIDQKIDKLKMQSKSLASVFQQAQISADQTSNESKRYMAVLTKFQDMIDWMERVKAEAERKVPTPAAPSSIESESFQDLSLEQLYARIARNVTTTSSNLNSGVGEYHELVKEWLKKLEPLSAAEKNYWKTKMGLRDMAIYAESPKGDDFSIDLDKLKTCESYGFSRVQVLSGLFFHPTYGEAFFSSLQSIHQILDDRDPYAPYSARNLTPAKVKGEGHMSFKEYIKGQMEAAGFEIIEDAEVAVQRINSGEAGIIPAHVFDTAFQFAWSTDMLGTVFLNDTVMAITKNFGAEDHTFDYKPEGPATYNLYRYRREATAPYFLFVLADLPHAWAEGTAIANHKDDPAAVRDARVLEETHNRVESLEHVRGNIREWVGALTAGGIERFDALVRLAALDPQYTVASEEPAFQDVSGTLTFLEVGSTFPTFYEFLHPTEKEKTRRTADYSINMYVTAWGGWVELLNMVKEPPAASMDVDAAKAKIDALHGALGKAKIIPGRHHNAMNALMFLVYWKIFKFTAVGDQDAYAKLVHDVLEKVEITPEAVEASGGGIPAHVRRFLTMLLTKEKDVLRNNSMAPHHMDDLAVAHKTHGLSEAAALRVGLLARLEQALNRAERVVSFPGVSREEGKHLAEIGSHISPIKWDKQNVSTKQGEDGGHK